MLEAIGKELRIVWRLLRDPRVGTGTKLIPLIVLAYLISPIDLIPDVIIGLGQVDDLAMILAGLKLFETLAPPHVLAEHRAAIEGRAAPAEDVVEARDYTIRRD